MTFGSLLQGVALLKANSRSESLLAIVKTR